MLLLLLHCYQRSGLILSHPKAKKTKCVASNWVNFPRLRRTFGKISSQIKTHEKANYTIITSVRIVDIFLFSVKKIQQPILGVGGGVRFPQSSMCRGWNYYFYCSRSSPNRKSARVARLFHRFTDYTITSTGTTYIATDTTTTTTATTTTIASTTSTSTATATTSRDLQIAVQGRLQVRTLF